MPVEEAPQVAGFLMAAIGDWATGVARPAESARPQPWTDALAWARGHLDRLRTYLRHSA
jgi:hypothetical protein